MRRSKKNGFLNFCCSFLPGAAEMYMGFMKMGLSLMFVFFGSVIIPTTLGLSDSFIMMTTLIWFLGFFHARNLATLPDQVLENIPDQPIWYELFGQDSFQWANFKTKKWLGIIMILLGLSGLWHQFSNIIVRIIPFTYWDMIYPIVESVPRIIFILLFILLGVKLILGKKKELGLDTKVVEIEDKEKMYESRD